MVDDSNMYAERVEYGPSKQLRFSPRIFQTPLGDDLSEADAELVRVNRLD